MKALGMIEVYGYVAAVEALDSALKAANVKKAGVVLVKGGLVSVMVTGDVGAVNAAVSAAAGAAERLGPVISTHVIPRPAEGTYRLLGNGPDGDSDDGMKKSPPGGPVPPAPEVSMPESVTPQSPDASASAKTPQEEAEGETAREGLSAVGMPVQERLTKEEMRNMTVAALRNAARQLNLPNMTRRDIRYAKKEQLIRMISAYLEQGR